ncbi:uncharacterized protein LOC128989735 isoform X1 [Macrosteles quadrilineatus]|uniref:uncharacterized protein LOC128989735 isoform X1 n=2 Tax=Macrosteles quadrilineatus TaxID=74068 RepID=UPI0023E12F55|nr:uncharacterized protein LOC128989735 isoform X1 [Macrosteles quadrilineatus]
MISSHSTRKDILNMMCRICAREDCNSIDIFGVEGVKQNLVRKIHACLPVTVRQDDNLPKQICLTCLTKLDTCWAMYLQCKEAQTKIEKKLYSLSRERDKNNQENLSPSNEDACCGVCGQEVGEEDYGVGCEGVCKKWFHTTCVQMTMFKYNELLNNPNKSWLCQGCKTKAPLPKKITHVRLSVEDRLRDLTETYPVNFGESAVICLAPDISTPTTSVNREAQVVPQAPTAGTIEPVLTPVTYLAPATATPTQQTAPAEEIYPQALIQVPQNPVSEQPIVYQNPTVVAPVVAPVDTPVVAPVVAPVPAPQSLPRRRTVVPKPMSVQASATPQRAAPTPVKRPNEENFNNINGKKLCVYCNKYFTDDIIDHHTSLHLRQTFHTCLDCNKNFRSEQALERHRCENNSETINLDDDDELIIV